MCEGAGGSSSDLEAGRTYVQRPKWRGIPASLEPHALFSTPDPVVAQELGKPFFGQHRLVIRNEGFCATLHAAVIGAVTLGYLHVTTSVGIHLVASAPRFLVLQPMAGRTPVRIGTSDHEASEDRALVLQPGQPSSIASPADATHLLIGVERHALHVHLSRLLGRALDRPLVFDPELDLVAATASRWNLAVEVLHAELSQPGSLLRSGIGRRPLEEFLMSALLYGHRSTYSAALTSADDGAESRAMAAAKEFIEANLAEPLTVAMVAEVAGVSPRTLQAGFRTELRTTPTTYIRSRRLDRARDDLVDAGPDQCITVTGVATRWGFTHLGRFASEYRDRFGETPSQTLHGRRR